MKCDFTFTNQPCDELPAEEIPCTLHATHVGVMRFHDEEGTYEEKVFSCAFHAEEASLESHAYGEVVSPFTPDEVRTYRGKGNWDVHTSEGRYLRTEWSG